MQCIIFLKVCDYIDLLYFVSMDVLKPISVFIIRMTICTQMVRCKRTDIFLIFNLIFSI